MEFELCVGIILVLLCIHVLCFVSYWEKGIISHDEEKGVNDIILKTGDIVCFKNCIKCGCTGDILNDMSEYVIKNTINMMRYYVIGNLYTHVGIIFVLNNVPYIYHINNSTYYDCSSDRIISNKPCLSSMNYIDEYNGVVHVYSYNGICDVSDANIIRCIHRLKDTQYPHIVELFMNNGLHVSKNNTGVMACTDLVIYVCRMLNIINDNISDTSLSISDVMDLINSKKYINTPVVLRNRCNMNRHYTY